MKKTFLTLAIVAIAQFSYAQWTTGTDISNTNSGNVGIGTTSPTRILSLQHASTNTYMSWNNSGAEKWVAGNEGTAGDRFIIYGGSTPDYRLSILSNGNVGIGTVSPSNNLQIGATASVSTSSPITMSLGATYSSTHGMNPKLKVYDDGTNFWGLGISSSQLDYIVNGSSYNHVFYAGGTELMRINGNGNVGIGTTSPQGKFQVVQGVDIWSGIILGAAATDRPNVSLRVSDNSERAKIEVNGVNGGGGDRLGLFAFNYGSLNEVMSIKGGGNVGIGTTNPSDPVNGNVGTIFDIGSSGATNTDVVLHTASTNNSGGGIFGVQTSNSVTGSPFIGEIGFSRSADVTSGKISGISEIYVNNDGTPLTAMHISSNGNIGIGTANPDEKLSVNGTIHTKEVKVNLTGWMDYVFKPKYHLPSLSEVKTYIDKNQHLPDMPSEQEVVKDGINLGEMNKLLTKKVEELTLYLIKQQNQIDKQNKRIAALEKSLIK